MSRESYLGFGFFIGCLIGGIVAILILIMYLMGQETISGMDWWISLIIGFFVPVVVLSGIGFAVEKKEETPSPLYRMNSTNVGFGLDTTKLN